VLFFCSKVIGHVEVTQGDFYIKFALFTLLTWLLEF